MRTDAFTTSVPPGAPLRAGTAQRAVPAFSNEALPFSHANVESRHHDEGEVLQPFLRDQRQVFQVWKDEVTAWVC
jgi:hypothetical protein